MNISNQKKIIKIISNLIQDKRGFDITIINVSKLSTLTDYFILCTGDSEPQIKAIVKHIKDGLSKENIKPLHIEGTENLNWVLLDYIDIVINIFNPQMRDYYNIERLWSDAIITNVKNEK